MTQYLENILEQVLSRKLTDSKSSSAIKERIEEAERVSKEEIRLRKEEKSRKATRKKEERKIRNAQQGLALNRMLNEQEALLKRPQFEQREYQHTCKRKSCTVTIYSIYSNERDYFCSDTCKDLYKISKKYDYPAVADVYNDLEFGIWDNTTDSSIDGYHGFIYFIEHTLSNRIYIGKKSFAAGNWKTYTSSSKYLNEEMAANGIEHYKFSIVEFCTDKESLHNREMELLAEFRYKNPYLPCGNKRLYNKHFAK